MKVWVLQSHKVKRIVMARRLNVLDSKPKGYELKIHMCTAHDSRLKLCQFHFFLLSS